MCQYVFHLLPGYKNNSFSYIVRLYLKFKDKVDLSLTKAEIKAVADLRLKKYRQEQKRFTCEGVRLLEEALLANFMPESVLYSPYDTSNRAIQLIANFKKKRITVHEVSSKECQKVSDTKSSQGIVAVFPMNNLSLKQQLAREPRKVLVCDRINDPGNLGTLMRSAAAFGFSLLLLTDETAEATNPKTIRASMGAFFTVPCIEQLEPEEMLSELRECGYKTYNADIEGTIIDDTAVASDKSVLIIGSEATGARDVFSRNADFQIKIPMATHVESLNAAMAGTVLMYWMDSKERART